MKKIRGWSSCPECGHHLSLRSEDDRAYCPICDKEFHRCPECGGVLECKCVIGADQSGTGKTERLYVCHGCLSSWSRATDNNGVVEPIERYFFG